MGAAGIRRAQDWIIVQTTSSRKVRAINDLTTNEIPMLSIRGLNKSFGSNSEVQAVGDLNLDVLNGEIFTLLGPSGCGKTTTLRLIGGLEYPDSGQIILNGRPIVSVQEKIFVPPHKRNMGMVFQSYAVWPHLTVFENIAYPLKARHLPAAEIRNKVSQVVSLLGLDGLEGRPGPLLSGGQQQRVALARALVYEPGILLLDEPFSNLDAKLREQMRIEVKLIQRELGIGVVLVTHDQVEALSLSDRLAVFNEGKLQQVGRPEEVYQQPQNQFVRDFMGRTLIMNGEVEQIDQKGNIKVRFADGSILQGSCHSNWVPVTGDSALVTVRPEHAEVIDKSVKKKNNLIHGIIDTLLFLGDHVESRIRVGGGNHIILNLPPTSNWKEGTSISISVPAHQVIVWPS